MNWADMVSKAKNEVIEDLAVIVADAQRQARIAFLRAEIERVEVPRAKAEKDRDKFKAEFEKEERKLGKLVVRSNQMQSRDDGRREAEAVSSEQAVKCRGIHRQYIMNRDAVVSIDDQLKELRAELRKLEAVIIHKPMHLDILRGVLNEH